MNKREEIDKNLKDNGMRTLTEIEEYRDTVGWVPYGEYMEYIYKHCPGRRFDEHSVQENFMDKALEPDRLLREAAYIMSLKHRPCCYHDSPWNEKEQLEFEEVMYNKFRAILKEWE
mgnify:CR=1 FL=1|tara:strand:+ start:19252 stop:19599 length:348 start_codon:yes stop_codon:yes gene_type:complete